MFVANRDTVSDIITVWSRRKIKWKMYCYSTWQGYSRHCCKKYVHILENKINVWISQTIIQGYFNMINSNCWCDRTSKDFTQMCDEMEKLGDEIGVSIRCQREDILKNAQIIREEFIRRHRIERINNMINMYEVSETNEMIEHENLDKNDYARHQSSRLYWFGSGRAQP